MEKKLKKEEEISKEIEQIHKEIQPALYESRPSLTQSVLETKNDLNSKILKITMMIKRKHPELNKYLKELPVINPNKIKPEITNDSLLKYYDSLKVLMKEYGVEYPDFSK